MYTPPHSGVPPPSQCCGCDAINEICVAREPPPPPPPAPTTFITGADGASVAARGAANKNACAVCGGVHSSVADQLLRCDAAGGCGRVLHMRCCRPVVASPPAVVPPNGSGGGGHGGGHGGGAHGTHGWLCPHCSGEAARAERAAAEAEAAAKAALSACGWPHDGPLGLDGGMVTEDEEQVWRR